MEDIFNKLANICNPTNITIGTDFISLDFGVKRSDIYTGNLTEQQINALDKCDKFEQRSQFLYGFKDRKLVFEAYASFWNKEEVQEHLQYFRDKSRNFPHWEINTNGFFTNFK